MGAAMNSAHRVGDNYSLATGAAGAERLALVDEVYGPDAARILAQIGIPRGGRIVDLGCGTGNSLLWFAEQVGPEGEVTGVDVSAEQLAIAAEQAKRAGHRNIRLVEANVYETGLPRDAFDVVHCRFLLCHLVRSLDGLREMAAIAKPGGLVIAFDVDLNGLFSVPPTPAYERMRALFQARRKFRGTDSELGFKLPQMFLEVGLERLESAIIHPIYLRGEGKRLWEYTLLEGTFMVDNGICDQAELNRLAAELAAIAADETIAVAQATMPVTWARKPVAG
jgi:ubiquinone/menaquinone biosynthesis C-methylase UbiE